MAGYFDCMAAIRATLIARSGPPPKLNEPYGLPPIGKIFDAADCGDVDAAREVLNWLLGTARAVGYNPLVQLGQAIPYARKAAKSGTDSDILSLIVLLLSVAGFEQMLGGDKGTVVTMEEEAVRLMEGAANDGSAMMEAEMLNLAGHVLPESLNHASFRLKLGGLN